MIAGAKARGAEGYIASVKRVGRCKGIGKPEGADFIIA